MFTFNKFKFRIYTSNTVIILSHWKYVDILIKLEKTRLSREILKKFKYPVP